jgi:hypothetical protein
MSRPGVYADWQVCLDLFEAASNTHSTGYVLRAGDYLQYFEAIRHESRIPADDARTDPRPCEFAEHYLIPLGITSMLDAGISLDGTSVAANASRHRLMNEATVERRLTELENARQADAADQPAWNLIVETYEALVEERGEGEKIWGSMIKQTLKRRKPGFSESYYGFKSFGDLLEQAEAKGILELERDQKSGGFIIKGSHTP